MSFIGINTMWLFIGLGIGLSIGVLIEYILWVVKCMKKGLFNKDGSLKNLKKKGGGE